MTVRQLLARMGARDVRERSVRIDGTSRTVYLYQRDDLFGSHAAIEGGAPAEYLADPWAVFVFSGDDDEARGEWAVTSISHSPECVFLRRWSASSPPEVAWGAPVRRLVLSAGPAASEESDGRLPPP